MIFALSPIFDYETEAIQRNKSNIVYVQASENEKAQTPKTLTSISSRPPSQTKVGHIIWS